MKSIAVIYTSMGGLVSTMKRLLTEALPDWKIVNIADDSLITEVMEAGKVTDLVRERLFQYYAAAAVMKPALIVSACSSVGAVAEEYDAISDIPVIRIDHAMISRALTFGSRIGVLASLSTTMEPTKDYILRMAQEAGKNVEVLGMVADGAYQANASGDRATHDRLLCETAEAMRGKVDVLLLAQGSMAAMEEELHKRLGIPVLSSPRLCVEEVAQRVKEAGKV